MMTPILTGDTQRLWDCVEVKGCHGRGGGYASNMPAFRMAIGVAESWLGGQPVGTQAPCCHTSPTLLP